MFNLKKILVGILFVSFLICSSSVQAKPKNEVYGGVSDGQMIFYSFKSKKWYYQRPHQRKKHILEVTRNVSRGYGDYSEYVSPQGQVYSPAGSNYEFLYHGRLITYHIYDVKFFEIVYNKQNKAFIEVPISDDEVKTLFGNPKIIHISDFDKNNTIVVRKRPLKRQWFLILNDTDKYFYRYMLDTAEKDRTIKTLFSTKKPTTLIFSHYIMDKDDFPPYQIRIKNGL